MEFISHIKQIVYDFHNILFISQVFY